MMYVFCFIHFGSTIFAPTPIGPSGREEGRMWPPVSTQQVDGTHQIPLDRYPVIQVHILLIYGSLYKNPINNGKFALSTGRFHYTDTVDGSEIR